MYIKRFSSNQFAGLQNICLDFNRGLNVIVGANETGKSTVVNAIYSVMFVNSALKKSRSDDKEFLAQYMPHPSGDFIDGEVNLYVEGQEYLLSRTWGNNSSTSLRKPDGSIITVESDVEDMLKTIFELGPRTYQNIVFARQSQLKEMLEKLREKETIHSVSFLLREAVMNLDGVSIDRLRNDIDAQLDELLKRWDYGNGRPQETRVYKTGRGIVLSSYYHQESLRQEMNRVFNLEQELHRISEQLHECETSQKLINRELQKLEPLEEDIVKRAEIEPRMKALQKQSSELKALSIQWPQYENEYQNGEITQAQLSVQMEQIKKEENAYRSRKEQEALSQTLQKIDDYRLQLSRLRETQKNMAVITEEDIKKLEDLNRRIITALTAMKAGKMLATIHKPRDMEVWVTRDLDNETRLIAEQIDANGYLKIRLGELAEIELKSGEFDFNKIKQNYVIAQDACAEHLKALGVKDLEEAKLNKMKLDEINRKIVSTEQLIANLSGGQDYDGIKTRLQSLGPMDSTRSLQIIQKDKENMEEQIIKIKARLMTINNKLQEWNEKYQSKEKLLDTIIAGEIEVRGFEAELGKLRPLPAGFLNAGQFRQQIKKLRDELKQGEVELREHWKEHDAKEREIPEESYEELKLQYESAQKELMKNLTRAEKLIRIKEAFTDTLAEMDSNSLQPLINSFSSYLTPTTRGRYKLGKFAADFDLELIRQDEVVMPINLLSSGTYDSVALSLRFAMLDHIFSAGNGFAVLDDCLVDLDPERRNEAVRIIKEYADKNQVIFTTCSVETADLLGGNIIKL